MQIKIYPCSANCSKDIDWFLTPKHDISLVPELRSCLALWICHLVPVVQLSVLTPGLTPDYGSVLLSRVSANL